MFSKSVLITTQYIIATGVFLNTERSHSNYSRKPPTGRGNEKCLLFWKTYLKKFVNNSFQIELVSKNNSFNNILEILISKPKQTKSYRSFRTNNSNIFFIIFSLQHQEKLLTKLEQFRNSILIQKVWLGMVVGVSEIPETRNL